jgi:hypothetical protein
MALAIFTIYLFSTAFFLLNLMGCETEPPSVQRVPIRHTRRYR